MSPSLVLCIVTSMVWLDSESSFNGGLVWPCTFIFVRLEAPLVCRTCCPTVQSTFGTPTWGRNHRHHHLRHSLSLTITSSRKFFLTGRHVGRKNDFFCNPLLETELECNKKYFGNIQFSFSSVYLPNIGFFRCSERGKQ